MKFIFTLLLLIAVNPMFAQSRLITGRLTDNSGAPLPGVNIIIKGTDTGTTTDADGRYSISASVGSTLVFAFVGFTSKEVVVTEKMFNASKPLRPNNFKPDKARFGVIFTPADSLKPQEGVAVLTNDAPTYNGSPPFNGASIRAIRKLGNRYYITTRSSTVVNKALQVEFTTSYGWETITQLPKTQQTYAQGQPINGTLHWRGADTKEQFSWGPLIRTLEYDGQPYPYDNNGALTLKGTGNGLAAKSFKSSDFFRVGKTSVQGIKLAHITQGNGNINFMGEYRTRSGVIPNSEYKRVNLQFDAKDIRANDALRLNTHISYNNSEGRLLSRGSNMASIMGAVLRTPSTFDNTNNLGRHAEKNNSSWLLSDMSMRSHSPGFVDNPYALIDALPDNEHLDRLIGSVGVRYVNERFTLKATSGVDVQQTNNVFGTPIGFAGYAQGRLTHRNDEQTIGSFAIVPSYEFRVDDSAIKLDGTYEFLYTGRSLQRTDGFGFEELYPPGMVNADSSINRNFDLRRRIQEVNISALYSLYRKMTLRLSNRSYFSNTLPTESSHIFLPTIGVKVFLSEILRINPEIQFFSSFSKTLRESALVYNDWSYASLRQDASKYQSFYELPELTFYSGLLPENEQKFEAGISFRSPVIDAEITYYNNRIDDLITPAQVQDVFVLNNTGNINNTGVHVTAGYRSEYRETTNWGVSVSWEKINSKVLTLNANTRLAPLAGFNSIQTALVPGESAGAIYGTTYKRNDQNKLVIGPDGYPLVDQELKLIGSTIPDWKLGFNSYIDLSQFKLNIALDYKHGGDMYNGTRAALDYLGRSAETESGRNISNYVYEGVTTTGAPNTTAVNFLDPAVPIEQSRWVRYGFTGVGEDYIEDASWLRLSELAASYTIRVSNYTKAVKEVMIAIVGQNLLLITPYRGVDPSSKLFAYTNGTGIDLFNQPSTRSYSIQLTIKI